MKDIDADYYGYRDDDDGILLPLEQKAEQEARERTVQKWSTQSEKEEAEVEEEVETIAQKSIPSQQDIQEALLARKKQELLEKYVLWQVLFSSFLMRSITTICKFIRS